MKYMVHCHHCFINSMVIAHRPEKAKCIYVSPRHRIYFFYNYVTLLISNKILLRNDNRKCHSWQNPTEWLRRKENPPIYDGFVSSAWKIKFTAQKAVSAEHRCETEAFMHTHCVHIHNAQPICTYMNVYALNERNRMENKKRKNFEIPDQQPGLT